MHPITLQFDDEDVERSLRARTLDASQCVLALFAVLDIMCRVVFPVTSTMFDLASDTSTSIAYTCTTITHTTVLLLCRYGRTLPGNETAAFQDRVWSIAWGANVAVWWGMQHTGLARRLTASEGHSAAVMCAMWGFVMVIQHALHIGFKSRMIVMTFALTFALTSVAWRKEMLAALMVGEAIGYSIEHMVRSSYLPRAHSQPLLVKAWRASS